MLNETNVLYSFGTSTKLDGFDRACDSGGTVIYEPKEPKKLPLLAVVGFGLFATSPASDYTVSKQSSVMNPIDCLLETVSRMEKATSLAFSNDSLENFLHTSVHAASNIAAQEQDHIEHYSITPLNIYSDFDFSPEEEFNVVLNVTSIEEGDFNFDEDNIIFDTHHAIV